MTEFQSKNEASVKRLSSIEPILESIQPPQLITKSETETTFVTDQKNHNHNICVTIENPSLETVTTPDINAVSWITFTELSEAKQATVIRSESFVVEAPSWWADTITTAIEVFNENKNASVLSEDFDTYEQQSGHLCPYTQVDKRLADPSLVSEISSMALTPGAIYLTGVNGNATLFTPHQTAEAYKWTIDKVNVRQKNIFRAKILTVEKRKSTSRETVERYRDSSLIWVQQDEGPEECRDYTTGFIAAHTNPLNGFYAQRKWNSIHVEIDTNIDKFFQKVLTVGDYWYRTRSMMA